MSEDDAISSNAAEKLKPLLAHDLNRRSSLVCQERLDTIDEITSMTSSYIQDESSKSEEELELSGHVRSYRDIKRNLTPLREAHLSETSKRNVKQVKYSIFIILKKINNLCL